MSIEVSEQFRAYIFVNGKIKSVSLSQWSLWFNDFENRKIDRTIISDNVYVSTIFLGIDHSFNLENWNDEKPILFESMVMGGKFSNMGWRYSSCGEAKRGHWLIVDRIRAGLSPDVPFGERPWMEEFLDMFKSDTDTDNEAAE